MRRLTGILIAVVCCLLAVLPTLAQDDVPAATPTPDEKLWVTVFVESANIRSEPSLDAAPSASAFEGQRFEAVGRNADGTWFEITRPFRSQSLGWISISVIRYAFDPTRLALTDSSTGVTGATAISDSGLSVYVFEEVTLRAAASRTGARIGVVPVGVTVPVIGRNADATWLEVNYLGTVGWISRFSSDTANDLLTAPETTSLAPDSVPFLIIPPEIQLAQLERLRAYVTEHRDFAESLANLWEMVLQGEIMPCEPPAFITDYQYSQQDVVELPEVNRYAPRANTAVGYINSSVAVLVPCGIFSPDTVRQARAYAINARIILDATLDLLDDLEENVIR